jgi:lipopolysaccharide biosynthesis glycosyltransferase
MFKKMSEDTGLRLKHLRRIFVEDTTPEPIAPSLPETKFPIISLVASTDARYLPHLGALIASVLSNANQGMFIDFLVLDGGLAEYDRRSLISLESIHPNCKISFIDMSREFEGFQTTSFFTISTFYRLAMPRILINRDRVLFLDTDMIVTGDVAELFQIDLGEMVIGAVRDLIMKSFYAAGVRSNSETGGQLARNYLCDYLGMGCKADEYFQAGVILFDLKKFREAFLGERMIMDMAQNHYWFLDQDVLNKHLLGKTKFIGHEWNVVTLDVEHKSFLSKSEAAIYIKSLQSPKIVHFAGFYKPWESSESQFRHYYWYYLRLTPWYEITLLNYLEKHRPSTILSAEPAQMAGRAKQSIIRKFLRGIWHFLPRKIRLFMQPLAVMIKKIVN